MTILDTLVVRLGTEIFGTDGLRRLERGVAKTQARLESLAAGAAKFGLPLAAGAGLAVKTLFDFEVAMNQVQATLGATDEAMASLRDQAKKLGRTTEFSASQAAEAQTQLAQAGFDVNQILAATPDVLALASAGQISMAEAAKLTANQLRAFGLDIDQAGRVTDVLAATASKANTSVSELGPAFRQVAPIAAEAGLSIEQTAGYLALLRDRGFAAEQAGTAVRAVLARLLNPSKEVRDELDKLGLEPGLIAQKVKAGEFQDVLVSLRTAGLDVGGAMKLFGTEAGAAGIVMVNNADDAAALTAQLEAADGAAQRMADTQNKGLVGAVRNLKSAFEGLQIAIGESGLGAAVESTARKLTDFTNWLTESEPWVRKLMAGVLASGPALLAFGAAAKGVAFALGGLAPAVAIIAWIGRVTGITTAAQWLWNAALAVGKRHAIGTRIGLAALAVQQWAYRAATGVATAAQWALNAAMLANPIGLVIAAVVALSAALIALWWWWDDITAIVGKATDAFLDLLREWGVPVDDIFAWLGTAWKAVVDTVTAPITGLWDWLADRVATPFAWLSDLWTTMTGGLTVTGVWDWLSDRVATPFAWLSDLWTTMTGGLTVTGVWDWLSDRVATPFAWLSDLWTTMTGGLTVTGVWDWLSDRVATPFAWLSDLWTTMTGGLTVTGCVGLVVGAGGQPLRVDPGQVAGNHGCALGACSRAGPQGAVRRFRDPGHRNPERGKEDRRGYCQGGWRRDRKRQGLRRPEGGRSDRVGAWLVRRFRRQARAAVRSDRFRSCHHDHARRRHAFRPTASRSARCRGARVAEWRGACCGHRHPGAAGLPESSGAPEFPRSPGSGESRSSRPRRAGSAASHRPGAAARGERGGWRYAHRHACRGGDRHPRAGRRCGRDRGADRGFARRRVERVGRTNGQPAKGMSIQRPLHLTRRQIRGRMFGESATLITVTTTFNAFGEPVQAESPAPLTCATAPASEGGAGGRVRELMEGGIALEAMRVFWTVETPRPVADDSAGDIIVFPVDGERWRVHAVEPWGGFSECVGVRQEGQ